MNLSISDDEDESMMENEQDESEVNKLMMEELINLHALKALVQKKRLD